jgi:hypothetical protein
MTTLMAERRRGLGDDSRQEALFGGEALAPARPPWAPAPPEREVAAPERAAVAPDAAVVAPGREVPERAAEIAVADEQELRTARAPLAGPTLDDVMSRVWEGLVMGLPAACPVCQGEVVPSRGGPLRGRCSSCDTTID